MNRKKTQGFTLMEVVIACSIFAIVVVGIIMAINRSYTFMNNTKLSVRAANLAREGVEMMYTIRDTNRRRNSGERDKFWLRTGEINKAQNDRCELTSSEFSRGIYVLEEEKCGGNDYLYAKPLYSSSSDAEDNFYSLDGFFSDAFSGKIEKAKLDFTGTYKYFSGDTEMTGKIEDEMVGGGLEFYRIMRVYGIYCKDSTSSEEVDICKNNDSAPKEMRFCVKVFYRGNGQHSSELCSIITNFMK